MRNPGEVARRVAAGLEGGQSHGKTRTFWAEGKRHGYVVSVKCWGLDTSGWKASAVAPEGSPPLLLEAWTRDARDDEVIARGAMRVVTTGDAAFDGAWCVEGAPEATVRSLLDPEMRAGISTLKRPRTVFLDTPDGTLRIDGRDVAVHSSAKEYDDEEILRDVDLVVRVCTLLGDLATQRRGAPLTPDEQSAEKAAIERLRADREKWWPRAPWRVRVFAIALALSMCFAALAFVYGSCVPG
jgi:hypothetical protein